MPYTLRLFSSLKPIATVPDDGAVVWPLPPYKERNKLGSVKAAAAMAAAQADWCPVTIDDDTTQTVLVVYQDGTSLEAGWLTIQQILRQRALAKNDTKKAKEILETMRRVTDGGWDR